MPPAAPGLRLLIRVGGIAALAVASDELLVRGLDEMASLDSIDGSDILASRTVFLPILLGLFATLALTTLSWTLSDEFIRRSRLPKIAAIGACSGALFTALCFLFCSSTPSSFSMPLGWPADATNLLIVEHVALAAMLGLTGGLVIAKVRTPARRVLCIATGLSLVTLAWGIGLYYAFDRRYEDLLSPQMFGGHAVVVLGWVVGLFAGPLGSIDRVPAPILEKP